MIDGPVTESQEHFQLFDCFGLVQTSAFTNKPPIKNADGMC